MNRPPSKSLLLSSLIEFWSLIEPLLLASKPQAICEIGIGRGEFTRCLLEFCAKNSCRYSGIDMSVDEKAFSVNPPGIATFFKKPSLDVLPTLAQQDVYFVDGDHNYYTVLNELRQILHWPDRWPLIFIHDTGQPWGRRDHYCAPDAIPQEFRHNYSTTLGVIPGRNELGEGGFSGNASDYSYGAVDHEGGPRNGVLTAVEDFLREPGGMGWRLVTVPGVFGLGILYAPDKCPPTVKAQLELLEKSSAQLGALLDTLESNRLELFLAHLKNLKDWGVLAADNNQLRQAYKFLAEQSKQMRETYDHLAQHSGKVQEKFDTLHQQYEALGTHNAGLVAHDTELASKYQDLLRHCDALQKAYEELKESTSKIPLRSSRSK